MEKVTGEPGRSKACRRIRACTVRRDGRFVAKTSRTVLCAPTPMRAKQEEGAACDRAAAPHTLEHGLDHPSLHNPREQPDLRHLLAGSELPTASGEGISPAFRGWRACSSSVAEKRGTASLLNRRNACFATHALPWASNAACGTSMPGALLSFAACRILGRMGKPIPEVTPIPGQGSCWRGRRWLCLRASTCFLVNPVPCEPFFPIPTRFYPGTP